MSSNTLFLNIKLPIFISLIKKTTCLIIVCTQISICSELKKELLIQKTDHVSFFQQVNHVVNILINTVKNLFTPKNYALIEYANTRYGGRMEDRNIIDEKNGIYAVFDGHGGQSAAQYIVDSSIVDNKTPRIVTYINDALQEKLNDAQALKKSLTLIEDELWNNYNQPNIYGYLSPYHYGKKETYGDSGATAIIAKKTGDILTIANVGDSRGVLIRNGKIIQTTIDHKPSNTAEKERVLKAGGFISKGYVGLGSVGFALTRTIGDIDAKKSMHDQQVASGQTTSHYSPILTAEPDIYRWTVKKDDILLLASDGLWDVMDSRFNANDNVELQNYLDQKIDQKKHTIDLNKVVIDLKREALKKESHDNITILAVKF